MTKRPIHFPFCYLKINAHVSFMSLSGIIDYWFSVCLFYKYALKFLHCLELFPMLYHSYWRYFWGCCISPAFGVQSEILACTSFPVCLSLVDVNQGCWLGWLVRVKPTVGDEAGYKANPVALELTGWRQRGRTLPGEYKMMCSEQLPFLLELATQCWRGSHPVQHCHNLRLQTGLINSSLFWAFPSSEAKPL